MAMYTFFFFFLQEHMSHLLTLDRLFISHYFHTREDTICETTGSRMKDMRKVSISKIKLSEVTWPAFTPKHYSHKL